jgi:putative two-component system response regulator
MMPLSAQQAPATAPLVLVVDDESANRELMTRLLGRHHYEVRALADGESALAFLRDADRHPDLILLDVMLPGMDGFSVCRIIKQHHLTRLIPIVLLTGLDAKEHKIAGLNAGADDFLTKPVQIEELAARAASLVRLKRFTDDLESAQSVIISLAMTVEARDPYTEGHCQRLSAYASALGHALGLSQDEIAALDRGGYLHDVGKIGVPDAVLLKTERLTPAEFVQMRAHTTIGERLCGQLRSLRSVRTIVRHHHERLDGSGYPDGLRGSQVPVLAQIVGVVDCYDAMTTTRPYRKALDVEFACADLLREARLGKHDLEIVRRFVDMDRTIALRVADGDRLGLAVSADQRPLTSPATGTRRDR